MQHQFVSIFLCCLLASNEALRILVVFPINAKSHSILGHGVVNILLEAGHEVVHITSFPSKKVVPKLREIDVSHIGAEFQKQKERSDRFKLRNLVGKGNIGDSFLFQYFVYECNKKFVEDETVGQFLRDPKEKFDVVLLEWFFSESIAGMASLFECPLIWFATTEAHWQVLRVVDEIPNTSYSVDLFSTSNPPLTFLERIQELWRMVKKYLILNLIVIPLERFTYYRVYSDIASSRAVSLPSYDDAAYNGSLLLLNSHPSIGTPYRLPQNAAYVAGYHIDKTVDPLPTDLQTLMDGSKQGVVYFNMGSNLKSVDMAEEMKQSLLNVFGKLKQTVIWKFEGDLKNVPKNVYLVKWAPQLSILAHPNLKLFITHGGQLSTTEAIHFGVPVIGIPVFGDQHVNMNSMLSKGFGIKVNLQEDLADLLDEALSKMFRNASYTTKAKEISQLFHDRIVSPSAELLYRIEHVVRTRGAPHLRSPALYVPLYQKIYLDLIALIVIVISLCYFVLKRVSKCKGARNVDHVKKKK